MSVIRPELLARLLRWRELLGALAIAAGGVWVMTWGGAFYLGLGLLIVLTGLGLGLSAIRQLRFRVGGSAPGIVQVDEGQITYLAPQGGGFVALSELDEVEMVFDLTGARLWRLSQSGFPTVTIPAAAQGAEALFDAFVSLPGARPGHIVAALDRRPGQGPVTVWRRTRRPALT
ncbi:hypothetical protein [Rhodovulum euryhalinum]|uniref:Uncharacterized protein n=1 Tax=Rhodovulum euryhalinum TaxID=35805 RepID=A0A4R2KNP8_9RHOB|nr:hypothetical protein [Rhodovulum euryhalinum]TCO71698.1 hypothetical protein EV655_106191 [Rhodovulum euryhalinum]